MMKMRYFTILIFCSCVSSILTSTSSSSQLPMCIPPYAFPILYTLRSQCPLSIHPKSLLHVNGDFLERALTSERRNSYTAVLFHASWCPFSQSALMSFDVLSSMYPHVEHLAVEQTSVMPSLFSRYGIHSLPALLMVKQNSRTRFHGSYDPDTLIGFYKQTTGSEPVQYIALNQCDSSVTCRKSIMQSWIGSSTNELLAREPYLIFSVLFISLRVVMYIMPRMILYYLRPIWASYRPRVNMEIFGETSQILGRILHIIDLKRVWSKVRVCKSRNFHRGARNARVWASSSLASVSFGKTLTSRLSS